MKWAKTTRYQTSVHLNGRVYNVLCESDFNDGYTLYINRQLITDIETLPTLDELTDIIADNTQIENTIKEGFLAAGVFSEQD